MLRDSFYTPKVLADKLINYINKKDINTVADFCVGDGELLRAAENRWPHAKFFGTDISNYAIESTSQKHPEWELSVQDFLDTECKNQEYIVNPKQKYDLILLNPPFSCIGGKVTDIELSGSTFQGSTAMTFLVEAINYLNEDGVLYAILPSSVAYSQKDNMLWKSLEKLYNLAILEESNASYFKGCRPSIILVSLNDFNKTSKYKHVNRISLDIDNLEVFRGKISMNAIPKEKGDHYLVHTTNLRNGRIENLNYKVQKDLAQITGPAILLPRVGNPNRNKMCIISEVETYILSDCIIAIKGNSLKNIKILFNYLNENWDLIEEMYSGTGARYITIKKIEQFLNLDILPQYYSQSKAI